MSRKTDISKEVNHLSMQVSYIHAKADYIFKRLTEDLTEEEHRKLNVEINISALTYMKRLLVNYGYDSQEEYIKGYQDEIDKLEKQLQSLSQT